MLKRCLSAAAGNSGETRPVEKSVQSLPSRAMGGQSMELHEINDTHIKTARWAERINTILHTHTHTQTCRHKHIHTVTITRLVSGWIMWYKDRENMVLEPKGSANSHLLQVHKVPHKTTQKGSKYQHFYHSEASCLSSTCWFNSLIAERGRSKSEMTHYPFNVWSVSESSL